MSTAHEVLQDLEEAQDAATQLRTLRTIKNSLTGHELRKIEYIRAGLIPTLDRCLFNLTSSTYAHKGASHQEVGENSAIWSHASSILGILANGGTAYTYPILQSDLLEMILEKLRDTEDGRLELVILRCLNNIAENLPLESEREWNPSTSLARLLYTYDNVARLACIINSRSKDHQHQQSKEAVLSLICKTCTSERYKILLVDAKVLDGLCDDVAIFIAFNKTPVWQGNHYSYVMSQSLILPPDTTNHISLTLETIAVLIERSTAYAKSFVAHNALLTVMTEVPPATAHTKRYGESLDTAANCKIPLPIVPDVHSMNAARRSPFPPLSASTTTVKRRTASVRTPHEQSAMILEDEDKEEQEEYLTIPWLLYIVRSSRGRRRLVAARLLGILKFHGLMHPIRARSLAALLVPILVDMIERQKEHEMSATTNYAHTELVPSVLALVVRDNEYLQKAAVESRAIPRLTAALKSSFEVSQELATALWWPRKLDEKLTEGEPGWCLGPGGPSSQMRINMQWREGLLQALASLAPDNETYRKEIVDQGALTQIISALEPFYCQITSVGEGDTLCVHGNSSQTLIAACGTVRALTRSATSLRTKLVDADIAKPIVKLLHTADPEVRIAATMVMANLAHDFSPMKQTIEPVVRKLCEQAHSANARLRHESLFALKALVNNSKNELKRKIVEELGPNWIKHLIATDPHDVPPGEVIGLTPKDYRKGSMVRVSGDSKMEDLEDNSPTEQEPSDAEDFNAHTLQQDLDIQAELLGFLRNLTTGERPEEIIEYLLEHIGQDDFLQILNERLKSGVVQRPLASSPPAAIIFNSLYILTHLCSAERKYRQLICQNLVIMRQTSALLGHADAFVRRAACWLVTNLVYANNNESHEVLLQRAKELQRLGIMNQVRRMEKNDPVVDVRERAATASECFGKLLDRT